MVYSTHCFDFLLLENSLVTRHSCLGVSSYLGEKRLFKVAELASDHKDHVTSDQDHVASCDHTVLGLGKGVEGLTLDENSTNGEIPRPNFFIYKVTSNSQLTCRTRRAEVKGLSGLGGQRCGLLEVGGAERQKELLKKLVLYPLDVQGLENSQ